MTFQSEKQPNSQQNSSLTNLHQDSTNSGSAFLRSSAARFSTRPRARGFSWLHSPDRNTSSADFTASSISPASPDAKVASLCPVAGFTTSPICPFSASTHLPFNQRPKWGTLPLENFAAMPNAPGRRVGRWRRCAKVIGGATWRWKAEGFQMMHGFFARRSKKHGVFKKQEKKTWQQWW